MGQLKHEDAYKGMNRPIQHSILLYASEDMMDVRLSFTYKTNTLYKTRINKVQGTSLLLSRIGKIKHNKKQVSYKKKISFSCAVERTDGDGTKLNNNKQTFDIKPQTVLRGHCSHRDSKIYKEKCREHKNKKICDEARKKK